VSFDSITLCVALLAFITVSVCFIVDSVLKLLDIPSYFIGGSSEPRVLPDMMTKSNP
jgi:hypothetical protein